MNFGEDEIILLHAIVVLHNMQGSVPKSELLERKLNYMLMEFVVKPKEHDKRDQSQA